VIIFGDSLTSGENNGNVSFADYLQDFGIEKYGISGNCLDDYSIYPVRGGLVSQINEFCRGKILIEYGINDAASLVTGYASIVDVKIAIAKVRDLLQDSEVYFLMLTQNYRDLMAFSKRYAKYLNEEYLKGLMEVSACDYLGCYLRICELMIDKFKTIYMLPDKFNEFDTDGIHPTDKGYQLIAENVKKQLK